MIDVHAHYLPDVVVDGVQQLSGRHLPIRHPEGLSDRIADLDAAGVERQIISPGALMPYAEDAAAAEQTARLINDTYAAAVATAPERFGAFGCLPLPHIGPAIAETKRCLTELNFFGIALGSGACGKAIDDPDFDPLWEVLEQHHAVVYLHPGVNNRLALGGDDFPMLLGPNFGSPAENGACVVRLALAGIPARCPHIRFVVAAMGGLLPFSWPHLMRASAMADHLPPGTDADRLRSLPTQLRRFWFDTSSVDEVSYIAARNSFGIDRLVFGSDASYGSPVKVRRTLDSLHHVLADGGDDTW